MKSQLFENRFEQDLLKELPYGRILIMDNAAFHKKEFLQNLAGKYPQTLIFLPPYSPECNPIEHTWSALNRNVAGCIHLYDSVSQALPALRARGGGVLLGDGSENKPVCREPFLPRRGLFLAGVRLTLRRGGRLLVSCAAPSLITFALLVGCRGL